MGEFGIAPRQVQTTEDLFTVDKEIYTCCGGVASMELSLFLIKEQFGASLANRVARYLFYHNVRGSLAQQNPKQEEPIGKTVPQIVRQAIDLMEKHLEDTITVPEICAQINISQRQLARVFMKYVKQTPVKYYINIRLDRARGLVTQTDLKFSEIAIAAGFNSQIHFSRAYRDRFGLSPRDDRTEGRVPFEFRPWPMYNPKGN